MTSHSGKTAAQLAHEMDAAYEKKSAASLALSEAELRLKSIRDHLRHEIRSGATTGDVLEDHVIMNLEDYQLGYKKDTKRALSLFRDEIAAHQGEPCLTVYESPKRFEEGYYDTHSRVEGRERSMSLGVIERGLEFNAKDREMIIPSSIILRNTRTQEAGQKMQWKAGDGRSFTLGAQYLELMLNAVKMRPNNHAYRDPTYPEIDPHESSSHIFIGDVDVRAFFYLGIEGYKPFVSELKGMQTEDAKHKLRDTFLVMNNPAPMSLSYANALLMLGRDVPAELVTTHYQQIEEQKAKLRVVA